jgi:hypothetical protein
MNWEAFGAIAEAVGAIAVIATLFYLAVQIHQHSRHVEESVRTLRINAMGFTVESFSRYRALLAQSNLAAIYLKGVADYGALSDVERVQFGAILDEYLYSYSSLHHRVVEGTYDKIDWDVHLVGLREFLAKPGAATWWIQHKHKFRPGLVAEINQGKS